MSAPIWHSRVFQGLAAAAGFMFVAVLTAAAVNLQVQSGPDGWAVSTTLGQPQPFEPPPVSLNQISDLDTWFDTRLDNQLGNRLVERDVVTLASMPTQQFLTDGQVEQMTRRVADMLDTSLTERDLELDTRYDAKFENMQLYVDVSLDQQSNAFFYTVVDLVDTMQADHRDEIFEIGQNFGNLSADIDRRVAQANYRIDNLEMLLAASRSPEQ